MISFRYSLHLQDREDTENRDVCITVHSLPKISTDICKIQTKQLSSLFPGISNLEEVARPAGEVDVLIGLDYASFHPQMVDNVEHLVLYENRFRKCLGGRYPEIKEDTQMEIINVEVNHVNVEVTSEFFLYENLGIECPSYPKCESCQCQKCPKNGNEFSLKEQRELALIEKGLSLSGNVWHAECPRVRNPEDLPDNYPVAAAMLYSTEERLHKCEEVARMYQEEIDKMIENGFARVVEPEELLSHRGPIHYLCHHEVLKPDSDSTPCRIVFNTSKNYHGHILNEYWAKGPDLINNMLGVLTRFREDHVPMW